MSGKRRLIVGISGASGVVYGARLIEVLRDLDVETHLVITKSAIVTASIEGVDINQLRANATTTYANADLAAPISSGSFLADGMFVIPCSIKSMSEIATGVTSSLLSRAADVVLKERRRLVLAVRETPLHTGHLRTMTSLSEMGAIISPLAPAFYNRPATVDDLIDHTIGRLLDLFGLDAGIVKRWSGARPS
ncbi:UbiX family flavin prenyltransferase [Hyphomicrobium sp. MC1]|uniref:UbiX family flavin prenyltransferase n=1 Tax=Hyphomicrobium sp. (strain MC1) TaxID=717785 RepID=UPI000213E918|nr:UbiX family flavin prenyltransferase [Hyphomicrobium sp. MC1]CCB66580.1 3-octaprenyl-4-hydroxybenzoate carboxy-lyase [Hyphomicrobium sp. MC1]